MYLYNLIKIFKGLNSEQKRTLIQILELVKRAEENEVSEAELQPLLKGLFAGPAPIMPTEASCQFCGRPF